MQELMAHMRKKYSNSMTTMSVGHEICTTMRHGYKMRQLRQVLSEEQPHPGSQNFNRKIDGPVIERALDYTTRSLVVLLSTFKEPTPSDDIQRLSKAVSEDIYTQFDIRRAKDKFPKCQENTILHQAHPAPGQG